MQNAMWHRAFCILAWFLLRAHCILHWPMDLAWKLHGGRGKFRMAGRNCPGATRSATISKGVPFFCAEQNSKGVPFRAKKFLRKTKFQRRSFLAKKYKAHDPFPAQSKVSYIHRQIDHRRKAVKKTTKDLLLDIAWGLAGAALAMAVFIIATLIGGLAWV